MTRARDVANLIGSGNYSSTTFTATAGQTAFTISHTQGFVQVFMNGLLLDETVDYTSNGSAVTLTSGAAAGDEIEVVAYNTFSVGDALPKSGGAMTGALTVDAAAATPLTVDRATSDGTIIDVQKDGTSVGVIGTIFSDLNIYSTASSHKGIRFGSSGLLPTDNTGGLEDNTSDLGSSTYRYKDLYLSGGAYLGGTGASNHLEDYEEGTWTPQIEGTTTAGTHNVLSSFGTYVKIGRLVHLNFGYNANSGTGAGNLLMSGIPFQANNPQHTGHGGGFQYNSGVSYPSGYYEAQWVLNTSNYTSFYLRCNNPTGGNLDYIPYPTAPSYIRGTLFYEV